MNTEKQMLAQKGFYAVGDVAVRLGKPRQTVQNWATARTVEAVRIGKHWFVRWTSVVGYYTSQDPKAAELLDLSSPPIILDGEESLTGTESAEE